MPRFNTKLLLIASGVLAWLLTLSVSIRQAYRTLSDVSGVLILMVFALSVGFIVGGLVEQRAAADSCSRRFLPALGILAFHVFCWCIYHLGMWCVEISYTDNLEEMALILDMLWFAHRHFIIDGIAIGLSLALFVAIGMQQTKSVWAIGGAILGFWLVLFMIGYVSCAASLPWNGKDNLT